MGIAPKGVVTMKTQKISLIAGFAFFAAVAASPANATGISRSVSVKVYPHELVSFDGRALAINRIRHAASRLCWSGNPLTDGYKRRRCELQVTEQMIRQVENADLLAQWQGSDSIRTASRN
ncbi:UrcA family protein [Novosphingobium sp. ZN18A2]|uniref:UrcA family protein n=1 Tax=Novosphingobium sp. ZN18A2 TaxID=3079861 RepID=UPI0030CB3D39